VVREAGDEVELRNSEGVTTVLPKSEIEVRGMVRGRADEKAAFADLVSVPCCGAVCRPVRMGYCG
jgi:hypothetical protein